MLSKLRSACRAAATDPYLPRVALLLGASAALATAQSVSIDNDVPPGTVGRVSATVFGAGDLTTSGGFVVTANSQTLGVVTNNVIFEYRAMVEIGAQGNAVLLGNTSSVPALSGDDQVTSSGSLLGPNGNLIEWTAVSSIADGEPEMRTVYTFTAQTGTLGALRFHQYMDEDVPIGNSGDDVLFTRGSIGAGNLQIFTVDDDQVYGVSQSGILDVSAGLVNATFAGWAADAYPAVRNRLTGSGQAVSLAGEVNTAALPPFVHPVVGPAWGPRDITSTAAWDVDPLASTATIVTSIGGVPEPPTQPEVLVFGTAPAPFEKAFQTWSPFTVRIENTSGELATSAGDPVTVSLASGSGTLGGTLTRFPFDGVVTFDDLTYDVAETINLEITSSGLSGISGRSVIVLPFDSDLRVTASDLSFSPPTPNVGDFTTITARVHNAGQETSSAVARFYDGDPAFGGLLIGSAAQNLAIGASADLSVGFTPGTAGPRPIFVVVENLTPPEATPVDNRATRLLTVAAAPEELRIVAGQTTSWPGATTVLPITVNNVGSGPATITAATAGPPNWLTLSPSLIGTTLDPGENITTSATLSVPVGTAGAPLGGQPLVEIIPLSVATVSGSFDGALTVKLFDQPASLLTLRVEDASTSNPIQGAIVAAQDLASQFVTDAAGEVQLALPPGSRNLFAFAPGYVATSSPFVVPEGPSNAVLALEAGQTLAVETIVSRPLTTQQVLDRGVDVQDPINNEIFDFVVSLQIGEPIVLPNIELPRNPLPGDVVEFSGVGSGGGAGGGGGGSLIVGTFRYHDYGRTETWIVIPGEIWALKQFFEASIVVVNNSTAVNTSDVQLRGVEATLALPAGIGLPDLGGLPQSTTQSLPDLDAGASAQATWVIRGDEIGVYALDGGVAADLVPFGNPALGIPQAASARSGEFQVSVPRLRCDFETPGAVVQDEPFSFAVLVTNEGSTIANLVRVKLKGEDLQNCRLDPSQPQALLTFDSAGAIVGAEVGVGDLGPGESGRAEFRLISEVTGEVLRREIESGCTSNPTPPVTVEGALLEITGHPQGGTFCEGDAVTLSVVADSGGPVAYQWRRGGVAIPGANAADLRFTSIAAGDAGVYDVLVTSGSTMLTSAPAVVVVNVPPAFVQQPQSTQVCVGDPFSLTVLADGTPSPTYQWRRDGQDVAGATAATYGKLAASLQDAGLYECTASNACGTATSFVVTLLVLEPAAITEQPQSLTVDEGESASFQVVATGSGSMTYQWRKDGQDIAGATEATFSIPSTSYSDTGSYDCVVDNACVRPATSASATLVVNRLPSIVCNQPVALWSPDHELVDVRSAFTVTDPDGDALTVHIRAFSDESEEPETGDGTGRHAPDFKDERSGRGLLIRSERSGKGDGRWYVLWIVAEDSRGGSTASSCLVAVCPHEKTQDSLDAAIGQGLAAASTIAASLAGSPEGPPPSGVFEHGLADPLGPNQ